MFFFYLFPVKTCGTEIEFWGNTTFFFLICIFFIRYFFIWNYINWLREVAGIKSENYWSIRKYNMESPLSYGEREDPRLHVTQALLWQLGKQKAP